MDIYSGYVQWHSNKCRFGDTLDYELFGEEARFYLLFILFYTILSMYFYCIFVSVEFHGYHKTVIKLTYT